MTDDPEPMIRATNLSKEFTANSGFVNRILPGKQQTVQAVNSVDLDIQQGEILGLVGESGCGKTTLGKTLLRLHEPTKGQIYYNGTDITNISQRRFRKYRKDMQIIFQDPYSSLNPKMTAGEIIKEPMDIHGIHSSDDDRVDRVYELLNEVDLPASSFEKHPHEFSGGQRQRIMIAKALATEPSFIVADEPVSALDVSNQAKILNLLKQLQQEYNLTYLFIGHNISAVRFISDRMAVMYLGEIVELGDSDNIVSNPHHPYTEALISSIPEPGVHRDDQIILEGSVPSPSDPPTGCSFHPRCKYATEKCSREIPELQKANDEHDVACFHYQEVLNAQGTIQTQQKAEPKSSSEETM